MADLFKIIPFLTGFVQKIVQNRKYHVPGVFVGFRLRQAFGLPPIGSVNPTMCSSSQELHLACHIWLCRHQKCDPSALIERSMSAKLWSDLQVFGSSLEE
jgi:hypothetical protein